MDLETRKALREDLTRLSTEIAAGLRAQMLAEGSPVRARAQKLHADERVGDPFDLWTDLLARRAAVLWVLKSVYTRVLEDRRLLVPGRILDPESQRLFEHLAPNLGPTAYLRWVYRDLATPKGGLPELFAPQPAEIALPSDALSQKLIDLWRKRDPDTGQLAYRFDDEHFDGRLMGDLYQDLDPVVKKRYALLQTPDFILDFILDETLTPAIAEWGVEAVRVLDPACGSGHFLLAAFKRLVAGMRAKLPQKPVREVVEDVLGRVVGIDLNDYACALARARLIMTALEACGETDLGAATGFHPQVYWADALEQVERDDLGQIEMFKNGKNGKPRALLTRPEVRARLRPILKAGFHVVVGNPPYITEKDASKREYHKEKVGKGRRYVSAAGKYSLGAPFTERMLQLAVEGGFVGEITADSFMKREFGKALIEQVLARKHLTKVVSTSGAYIPGHGTSTVILFVRNRGPHADSVVVVMSKRGESGKPEDPAKGKVWSSIVEGHHKKGYESEFISVADVSRATMNAHPWSIGGGGAAELKERLETTVPGRLDKQISSIGFMAITAEDDAYVVDWPTLARFHLRGCVFGFGESVRDWTVVPLLHIINPYSDGSVSRDDERIARFLWPMRSRLRVRLMFGKTQEEAGLDWTEYRHLAPDKLRTPLSIAFAFKATHNHFVVDHGGKIFNRTAPVIKLPVNATEEQHLVLLAQLNSSAGEFWVKQTMQSMGAQGIGRGIATEAWEHFYERDGGKLESFPLVATTHPQLESFARHLDRLARERVADSPRSVLDAHAPSGAAALRTALEARRDRDLARLYQMVGLQEELDWLCYKLYGIDPEGNDVRDPEHVPPLRPGLRPFEITLAQEDAERRATLARGEEPDEQPTAWFERHGWEPVVLPEGAPGTSGFDGSLSAASPGTKSFKNASPEASPPTTGVTGSLPTASRVTKSFKNASPEASPPTTGVIGSLPTASGATKSFKNASPEASPPTTGVTGSLPTASREAGTSIDPIILARIERTAASRDLSLVEQPTYKRRWYRPDYVREEREALELWLADRLEAWAKDRKDPFTVRQAAAALRADPAVLAVAELIAGRPDFDLDELLAERVRLDSVPNVKHHVFKPEGLRKRAAWEQTWQMQHLEDAGKLPLGEDGKPVPIPVPPKYERGDYLKAEHWALRGKLDVPRERFIAFTEAPPEVSEEPLYGWAGWTHRERARALLALDEKAESAGVKVPDRYGLLYGVWFLLPYVAWESPQAASDFRADVKSLVGEQGVTEEMLEEWARRFPATRPRGGKRGKKTGRGARDGEASEG